MTTSLKVTDLEAKMIKALVNNDFSNGDPDQSTWTCEVCLTNADKAVLGSLIKKGLAYSHHYDKNSDTCGLTDTGKEVYATL